MACYTKLSWRIVKTQLPAVPRTLSAQGPQATGASLPWLPLPSTLDRLRQIRGMPAEAQDIVCSANTTDALQVQGLTVPKTGGAMTTERTKKRQNCCIYP